MGRTDRTTEAQKLFGQLQLARIQLSKAQSNLGSARERAYLAKRRRREAKLAARRAKKELKRAKAEVVDAREAVLKVEARLAAAEVARVRKQVRSRQSAQTSVAVSQRRRPPTPIRKTPPVQTTPPELVDDRNVTPKAQTMQQPSSPAPETATESHGPSAVESTGL